MATPTRRERLRAETSQEIKTIALRLMADGGPEAITLRAIAREIGMTAGALYGYYATRDDLITALIRDVYASLLQSVTSATADVTDPAARIITWAHAFRTWALTNPEAFRLIYGDPISGYEPPPGGPAPAEEHAACASITALVAAAWPRASTTLPPSTYTWSDFSPALADAIRRDFPTLPPAAVALSLRLWSRFHGLVSLEVYGHLGPQVQDTARLFHDDLLALIHSLALTPPPRPHLPHEGPHA